MRFLHGGFPMNMPDTTFHKPHFPLKEGCRLAIVGAPEGCRASLLARHARASERPLLHVVEDDRAMAATQEALAFLAPDLTVMTIPAWDCPPYSRISPNPEIAASRISALGRIAMEDHGSAKIVVTTARSMLQRLPCRSFVSSQRWNLEAGGQYDYSGLRSFLEQTGYVPAARVSVPGQFAVRGALIDVFPPGFQHPVRFEFFGDLLETIRSFDPSTQRTIGKLDFVHLDMLSEVVLTPSAIKSFRSRFRSEFGVARSNDQLYDSVSSGVRVAGIEHWLPLFHDKLTSLFEYLPGSQVFIDEAANTQSGIHWERAVEAHALRKEIASGQRLSGPCSPESLFLTPSELASELSQRQVGLFQDAALPGGDPVHDAGIKRGRAFHRERVEPDAPVLDEVARYLNTSRKAGRAVFACWSEGTRERLSAMLSGHGVETVAIDRLGALPAAAGPIGMAVWELTEGFQSPELVVVSEQDVFGQRLAHRSRRKETGHLLRNEMSTLVPGELVVHVEHGVGRFIGLETVRAANSVHDCIAVEYRKGDRLYLPTVNINLLSRFGDSSMPLDRLGGVHWQERKARLREEVLRIAEQLLAVAARRKTQQAPRMSVDSDDWNEFLARFPFVETEDQTLATKEILSDLESGAPMDRLVCGDVGFGKTEIAMRAALVAVLSGYQVAVVAPTTLLVKQHYERFVARFAALPVRIGQLSRLVDAKNSNLVRSEIDAGKLDIVIGTHALLGKSIKFKRLGLVVLDEEQAFGVLQKERFKELRASVHVLALTATPIPRTLKMSLSGARDLSLVSTPPSDRLAIRTFVLEFDPVTIREALLQEKARNGQSFFVVPRIKDISGFQAFLAEHVPEVSFISAHGRLSSAELERRTAEFYSGAADVLLSTTIIAAGLDIPTANTIIIAHAERFGLAQLHQIRGRVGRSRNRAYAYITHRHTGSLSDAARQRLTALKGADSLGAGFTLAARDLEIRGAGNLLGRDQSGHVREVGYELYQRMLEKAVEALRSGPDGMFGSGEDDWAPQLNLGVSAMIPESYVSSLELRLGLYRRLSSLANQKEIEGMASELIDRFGQLPAEVELLLETLKIKLYCQKAGIERLDAGPRGLTMTFRNNRLPNPKALLDFVAKQSGRARFSGRKLTFSRNWPGPRERMRGAFSITGEIAALTR